MTHLLHYLKTNVINLLFVIIVCAAGVIGGALPADAATFSVSGTAYSNQGTTPLGNGQAIRLVVNGTVSYVTTTSGGNGGFNFSAINANPGDNMVLYITSGGSKGVVFTQATGGAMAGMLIYGDSMIVRSDGGVMNIAAIEVADDGSSDISAIVSVVSGGIQTVSGKKLYIPAGHTFEPMGTIDANGDINVFGTLDAGANAITVAGNMTITGTLNHSGSLTYDGSGGQTHSQTGSAIGSDITISSAVSSGNSNGMNLGNNSLTINYGGSLTTNCHQVIAGQFNNNGEFRICGTENLQIPNGGSGTWVYEGNGGPVTIMDFGSTDYQNLIINPVDSLRNYYLANDLGIAGAFEMRNGILNMQNSNMSVNGNVTIGYGGGSDIVNMNGNTISLGGNWNLTGGGFLNSQGGEVLFTGSNQSVSGATDFYTVTKTNGGSLNFQAGSTQTISGALILDGSPGGIINLGSTGAGSQAFLNILGGSIYGSTGEGVFDYISVKDHHLKLNGVTNIDLPLLPGNLSNLGNTNGWFPGPTIISVSGVVYSDEGNTPLSGRQVRLLRNGDPVGSPVTTSGTGAYTFSNVTVVSGDVLTVHIHNAAEDGVTVTLVGTTNVTGLSVYVNRLIIRSETVGAVSSVHLNTANGTAPTTDLTNIYSDGSDPVVQSGKELFIWAGDTYAPGAYLNIDGHLDIRGTLYAGGSNPTTITIAGDWNNDGIFIEDGSSVIFNGGNQTIGGLYGTEFNDFQKLDTTNNTTCTTPAQCMTLTFAQNIEVNGILRIDGLDANDRVRIVSSPTNTIRTITLKPTSAFISGAVGNYLDVQYNTLLDLSTAIILPGITEPATSIDSGNTQGWFDAPPPPPSGDDIINARAFPKGSVVQGQTMAEDFVLISVNDAVRPNLSLLIPNITIKVNGTPIPSSSLSASTNIYGNIAIGPITAGTNLFNAGNSVTFSYNGNGGFVFGPPSGAAAPIDPVTDLPAEVYSVSDPHVPQVNSAYMYCSGGVPAIDFYTSDIIMNMSNARRIGSVTVTINGINYVATNQDAVGTGYTINSSPNYSTGSLWNRYVISGASFTPALNFAQNTDVVTITTSGITPIDIDNHSLIHPANKVVRTHFTTGSCGTNNVTVRGRAFTNEGEDGVPDGTTVRLLRNGQTPVTVTTASTAAVCGTIPPAPAQPPYGCYRFDPMSIIPGSIVTAHLDGYSQDGVVVTRYGGGPNLSGLDIYGDVLTVRDDDANPNSVITNNDLDTGNDGDSDITSLYQNGGGTNIIMPNQTPQTRLLVWPNSIYAPGGSMDLGGSLKIQGVVNAGSATHLLDGAFLVDSAHYPTARYNATGGTLKFDSQYVQSFDNLNPMDSNIELAKLPSAGSEPTRLELNSKMNIGTYNLIVGTNSVLASLCNNITAAQSPGTVSNNGIIEVCGHESLSLPQDNAPAAPNSGTWRYVGKPGNSTTVSIKDFGTDDYYNLMIKTTEHSHNVTIDNPLRVVSDLRHEHGKLHINGSSTPVVVSGNLYLGFGPDQAFNDTLNAGTGLISVAGNWIQSYLGNMTGTSTVTLNGTNQTVQGATAFYHLSKTNGGDLWFPNNTAQTVSGTLNLAGVAGNTIDIQTTNPVPGQRSTINVLPPNGLYAGSMDYISIKDSHLKYNGVTQAPPLFTASATKIDLGNTPGWFIQPDPVNSLAVTVTPVTLPASGGTTTVAWTVDDADSCTVYGSAPVAGLPATYVYSGVGSFSGSVVITLTQTTTVTVTCVQDNPVSSLSDGELITVGDPPPLAVQDLVLSTVPTNVPAGGGSTSVQWSVLNADSCTLSSSPTVSGLPATYAYSGIGNFTGSLSASVTSTTTFTMNCVQNLPTSTATATATVVAGAPSGAVQNLVLSADPGSFPQGTQGGDSDITWSVDNADFCTLSANQPIAGLPQTYSYSGSGSFSGSFLASITETTVFSMSCIQNSPSSSVFASKSVIMSGAPVRVNPFIKED